MNPLDSAMNKFFGNGVEPKTDASLSDAFKAGWDARNNDCYGKLKTDLDKCKEFLSELQSLQLSNGYAEKAKKLLGELK